MIAIRSLHNRYNIAGDRAARHTALRRLDHVCGQLLSDALEAAAGDFADPDGPVYKIRKLKLRLWLNMQLRSDGQIAQDWAQLVARALHRQLAEGGPDTVMRYPGQAAYLAAWISAVLDGVASDRWMYAEFAVFHDLPVGRAVVAGLARHPDHIAATLRALAGQGIRERVIAAMSAQDIAALWSVWVGTPPHRPAHLPLKLIQSLPVTQLTPPVPELGSSDARARHALRWLLTLVTSPAGLTPQVAGPLAMQLAQITALLHTSPALRRLWRAPAPSAKAVSIAVRDVPADMAGIAAWVATVILEPEAVRVRKALEPLIPLAASDGVLTSAEPQNPTRDIRLRTPFAGAALLLPALRRADADACFDAQRRHRLLCSVFTGTDRLLAAGDLGLRRLSGVPAEEVLEDADSDQTEQDLAAVLAIFRRGLRGMERASVPYLRTQFFAQSGLVILSPKQMLVRITSVPLRVLLHLGGRLGDQGRVPWLEDLPLRIEVGDG